MLNKTDKEQLLEKYDSDESFRTLFAGLMFLRAMRYPDLVMASGTPLRAGDIREGRPAPMLMIVNAGQDQGAVEARFATFRAEARDLVWQLAAHFPEQRRWHWQEVLFSVAVSGQGVAEQLRRGGAPKGHRDVTVAKQTNLAELYYSSSDELTQEEFARSWGKSRSTLRRALKESKNRS